MSDAAAITSCGPRNSRSVDSRPVVVKEPHTEHKGSKPGDQSGVVEVISYAPLGPAANVVTAIEEHRGEIAASYAPAVPRQFGVHARPNVRDGARKWTGHPRCHEDRSNVTTSGAWGTWLSSQKNSGWILEVRLNLRYA